MKRIQNMCLTCKKLQGKRYADRPDFREQKVAAFQVPSIDKTGVGGIRDERHTINNR